MLVEAVVITGEVLIPTVLVVTGTLLVVVAGTVVVVVTGTVLVVVV